MIQPSRLLDELRTRQARLDAMLEVGRELSRVQPVDRLLGTMAKACGQLLDSDSVGFRLVEGDGLVVAAVWGDAREAMPMSGCRRAQGCERDGSADPTQ